MFLFLKLYNLEVMSCLWLQVGFGRDGVLDAIIYYHGESVFLSLTWVVLVVLGTGSVLLPMWGRTSTLLYVPEGA